MTILLILIWNLADSKTTLGELREQLPELSDGMWIANEPAERFGLVSSADEMPDLQFVSIFQCGCVPLAPGNDFKIQLHGHSVRLHAELCDQSSHGQALREVALFAIDVEEHRSS